MREQILRYQLGGGGEAGLYIDTLGSDKRTAYCLLGGGLYIYRGGGGAQMGGPLILCWGGGEAYT